MRMSLKVHLSPTLVPTQKNTGPPPQVQRDCQDSYLLCRDDSDGLFKTEAVHAFVDVYSKGKSHPTFSHSVLTAKVKKPQPPAV